jgi:hypothetical protein
LRYGLLYRIKKIEERKSTHTSGNIKKLPTWYPWFTANQVNADSCPRQRGMPRKKWIYLLLLLLLILFFLQSLFGTIKGQDKKSYDLFLNYFFSPLSSILPHPYKDSRGCGLFHSQIARWQIGAKFNELETI